tara:strand:+ start:292 stop:570 length:279 start_codon:yes stop_codon:yes gene_type:complete
LFSIKLSLLINPIIIPIIKNRYVEFPVVKKLPVLLMGKTSAINKKIKGIIIMFLFKDDIWKYFLINVKYKTLKKIITTNTNPITPVSVNISK